MSIETTLAIASFTLGIGGTLWAVVQWYTSSQTKKYAAERDFQHLRRNQEQLIAAIESLAEDVDHVAEEIRTVSRVAQIILAKQGDAASELLKKRD